MSMKRELAEFLQLYPVFSRDELMKSMYSWNISGTIDSRIKLLVRYIYARVKRGELIEYDDLYYDPKRVTV